MNTSIIDVIVEAFSYPFFVRALSIGGLISLAGAVLGIYVVLRKESLIGHTISDVSFLGIAIGLALGLNMNATTITIAVAAAIIIVALQNTGRFSHDSVLAFTAEISLAIAIVIISRLEGYRVDLLQYLFGDILGISRYDVIVATALMPFILLTLFVTRKKVLQVTFNEELSISAGTNIFFYNALFTVLVAVTIAIGIKIVGVILMAAFLVIPANIAKTVARSFKEMVLLSAGTALLATLLGLMLSYVLDAPSGAMIVMSLGSMLFLAIIVKGVLGLVSRISST
ncbi:MAG: metal ABC transporter permease [Actinobacteria bacterium]|nr:metal ABC transporter permease [Actinomycetota bacterium]